jgi:hypothetical protein
LALSLRPKRLTHHVRDVDRLLVRHRRCDLVRPKCRTDALPSPIPTNPARRATPTPQRSLPAGGLLVIDLLKLIADAAEPHLDSRLGQAREALPSPDQPTHSIPPTNP